MGLRTVSVSKCLDKKLLIFGYEIPDILALLFILSILNFIFGTSHLKIFLVWLPTLFLAIALRVSKQGKPDNYLIHLLRFKVKPRFLLAFPDPSQQITPPKRKRI